MKNYKWYHVKKKVNFGLPPCDYPVNLLYRVYDDKYAGVTDKIDLPIVTDEMESRLMHVLSCMDDETYMILTMRYKDYASLEYIHEKIEPLTGRTTRQSIFDIINRAIHFLGKYAIDYVLTGVSDIFPINPEYCVATIPGVDFNVMKILFNAGMYTIPDIINRYNMNGGQYGINVLMNTKFIGRKTYQTITEGLQQLGLIDDPIRPWRQATIVNKVTHISQ